MQKDIDTLQSLEAKKAGILKASIEGLDPNFAYKIYSNDRKLPNQV